MKTLSRFSRAGKARRATVPACERRRGTTLIELMVVMSVMLVAVSIFYQMVLSTKRLRTLNHENAVAIEAARAMVERMRNENFEEVFALFNAQAADDPGAPGSAPGNRFFVAGLTPLPAAADGMVGEISFPATEIVPAGAGGGAGGIVVGGGLGGGGGAGAGAGGLAPLGVSSWELREDFVDDELGMPRDLNGDSIIDDEDRASDYLILPVRIRLEWEGIFGPRSIDLYTMIGEYRRL